MGPGAGGRKRFLQPEHERHRYVINIVIKYKTERNVLNTVVQHLGPIHTERKRKQKRKFSLMFEMF